MNIDGIQSCVIDRIVIKRRKENEKKKKEAIEEALVNRKKILPRLIRTRTTFDSAWHLEQNQDESLDMWKKPSVQMI